MTWVLNKTHHTASGFPGSLNGSLNALTPSLAWPGGNLLPLPVPNREEHKMGEMRSHRHFPSSSL